MCWAVKYGTAVKANRSVTSNHRRPKNVWKFCALKRERQRIVYIYSIHKVGNLISPDEHMTCKTRSTSLVELKTSKKL